MTLKTVETTDVMGFEVGGALPERMTPSGLAELLMTSGSWPVPVGLAGELGGVLLLFDLRIQGMADLVGTLVDLERALTPAQWLVLCGLAQGLNQPEMAVAFGVTQQAVAKHTHYIRAKTRKLTQGVPG